LGVIKVFVLLTEGSNIVFA